MVDIPIRRLSGALTVIAAGCFVLSAIANVIEHGLDSRHKYGLGLFELDRENSLPTWFAVMLLAAAAAATLLVGRARAATHPAESGRWLAMGAVLLAMSAEEIVGLHERIDGRLRDALDTSGALRNAWIIPAAALVLGVAAYLLPFVLRLEPPLRHAVLVAGAVFVGGAIGVEMVEGALESADRSDLWVTFAADVQELLEMLAVIVLLGALIRSIAGIPFRLGTAPTAPAAASEAPLGERVMAMTSGERVGPTAGG